MSWVKPFLWGFLGQIGFVDIITRGTFCTRSKKA